MNGAPQFIDERAPRIQEVGDVTGPSREGTKSGQLDAPLVKVIRDILLEVFHKALFDPCFYPRLHQ